MKKALIVDALNLFIRSYVVNPSISKNGDPTGGIVGVLKSLQKVSRDIKPDNIIFCWDGAGGSRKKKAIVSSYKEGRNPLRLNRNIKVLDENQELQNRLWQQLRTFEYINCCPVIQFMEENVEADDLVSYACQHEKFSEHIKVILSSDKDFIQLLNDKTILIRPVQEEILNKNRVLHEYNIHPNNFALARAIAGDKSDNLQGVRGVGLSTIAKKFPFLAEHTQYSVQDILDTCNSNVDKSKSYQNILNEKDKVEINYKIMQLYQPNISLQCRSKCDFVVNNFVPEFNKTEFFKMSIEDGFSDVNFADLFANFNRMIQEHNVATLTEDS